jgi:hypothetical protein
MLHTATTEAAAARLLEAQRTGCEDAIHRARAYQRFIEHQAGTTAATQREAARLDAIGPAGRDYERQAAYHYATR